MDTIAEATKLPVSKAESLTISFTRCPATPSKANRASWPGLLGVTATGAVLVILTLSDDIAKDTLGMLALTTGIAVPKVRP